LSHSSQMLYIPPYNSVNPAHITQRTAYRDERLLSNTGSDLDMASRFQVWSNMARSSVTVATTALWEGRKRTLWTFDLIQRFHILILTSVLLSKSSKQWADNGEMNNKMIWYISNVLRKPLINFRLSCFPLNLVRQTGAKWGHFNCRGSHSCVYKTDFLLRCETM
jgi:hypothetical protein